MGSVGGKIATFAIVGLLIALFAYDDHRDTPLPNEPAVANYNQYNAPIYKSYDFSGPAYGDYNSSEDDQETLSRDDAITEHWDEIKEYANGTETIEACSGSSGNCYDLDADINSGSVDTLHFPNGGYNSFSGEFDEDGNASDSSYSGDSWDFSMDMDSSLVDDAVDEWASDNGYEIE